MLNPSKQEEFLNSPTERASKLNDPQFENQQGYFNYDLTHQELCTLKFGEVTPTMHIDTVPADRFVVRDNSKLILNQINGNFLSNVNQYVDSFYVSLRNVMPVNYEKLMPNPTKGDDLPNTALPQVPFFTYLSEFIKSERVADFHTMDDDFVSSETLSNITSNILNDSLDGIDPRDLTYYLGRLTLLATILSRGQLLDYLGFNVDVKYQDMDIASELQYRIDQYFSDLWKYHVYLKEEVNTGVETIEIESIGMHLYDNLIDLNLKRQHSVSDLSSFRSVISDIFEAGRFLWLPIEYANEDFNRIVGDSLTNLVNVLDTLLDAYSIREDDTRLDHLSEIDNATEPFIDGSTINIGKILAYQQIIAHYFTNDHIDNIFSSELFMQNLRAIMFPSAEADDVKISKEPVFYFNGVATEYDYISYGGFFSSLISEEVNIGALNRQYIWATVMLLLRRSLRYGDYFSTARPNMLAITDQLGIAVEDGKVSPIDVTKNLLMQRYLNAANYISAGYLQYFSSMFGVKPSDTGCVPRFISHRKIPIQNQITNNTANEQGKQTTNMVAYSDDSAFDVFIDDFGYLLSLTSFDVLPIYKSGIDNCYRFSDRFDYFNPMLQNVGDQGIKVDEILGDPSLHGDVFGYTMRNAEYKYKISKAHGAFVNELKGFTLAYPLRKYALDITIDDLKINPDFVRDKPVYIDPIVPQMTGISPSSYYHFIVSCTNQVLCARKIQATPSVLF